MYPLSQAPWPGGMGNFKLALGEVPGVFYEGGRDMRGENDGEERSDEDASDDEVERGPARDKGKGKERVSAPHTFGGRGSQLHPHPFSALVHNDRGASAQRRRARRVPAHPAMSPTTAADAGSGLAPLDAQPLMDLGVDVGPMGLGPSGTAGARLSSPRPPRKRPRASEHAPAERSEGEESEEGASGGIAGAVGNVRSRDTSMYAAGLTAAALPSPNLSPPSPVPTFAGEDSQECREEEEDEDDVRVDLGSGNALSGLLSLPDFVATFDQLSPALQSYFIFTFLKRSSIPVLQTINNIIAPSLRRDFLTDLPPELGIQVLGYLDAKTLSRASVVCKGWRRLVDGEWRVWKERLVSDGLWIGDGSEEKEAKEIASGLKENLFLKRWRAGVWDDAASTDKLDLPLLSAS